MKREHQNRTTGFALQRKGVFLLLTAVFYGNVHADFYNNRFNSEVANSESGKMESELGNAPIEFARKRTKKYSGKVNSQFLLTINLIHYEYNQKKT